MSAPGGFRLSRREKLSLLGAALVSSSTTNEWRAYLPLARRKLVTIQKSGDAAWIGDMRRVEATESGRALADALMSDVSLWLEDACQHARERRPGQKGWCLCTSCAVSRRMRPTNG